MLSFSSILKSHGELNATRIELVFTADLLEDRRIDDVIINDILLFYHIGQKISTTIFTSASVLQKIIGKNL